MSWKFCPPDIRRNQNATYNNQSSISQDGQIQMELLRVWRSKWPRNPETNLQAIMCEEIGVSLSVTLFETRVPMDVRVSAPKTTPPSNSTATKVVPVETSFGAHDGSSGWNIFSNKLTFEFRKLKKDFEMTGQFLMCQNQDKHLSQMSRTFYRFIPRFDMCIQLYHYHRVLLLKVAFEMSILCFIQ